MTPPERLRALLAKPDFVVMPAVWDGLSAKLSAEAGFETSFLSGSCVAASRLGGPGKACLLHGETAQANGDGLPGVKSFSKFKRR